MNIGKVSKLTGLNTKTIRYYEEIDLVKPSSRSDNGYRQYNTKDLAQLQFVQRARKTGFNIEECKQLLSLYNNNQRHSHEVKSLVLEKAKIVAEQIKELSLMHDCLIQLASRCQSNEEPQCAILESLSNPVEELSRSDSSENRTQQKNRR